MAGSFRPLRTTAAAEKVNERQYSRSQSSMPLASSAFSLPLLLPIDRESLTHCPHCSAHHILNQILPEDKKLRLHFAKGSYFSCEFSHSFTCKAVLSQPLTELL